jgi:threonine dehydrogenase-like Zn-dependent dehydrogenase
VKRSVDCVGEENLNEKLQMQQNYVITQAIKCTSNFGGIGVPGVYAAQSKSKANPRADLIAPSIDFPFSLWWSKNLTIRGGIADIAGVQPTVYGLIKSGRARPGFIVSGVYDIDDAPEAYRKFDEKLETKVLFRFPWHHKTEGSTST